MGGRGAASMTAEQKVLAAVEESIAELQGTVDTAIEKAKEGLRKEYGGIDESTDKELERILADYEPSVSEEEIADYFGVDYSDAIEPLASAVGDRTVEEFYMQWSSLNRLTDERKQLIAGQMVMDLGGGQQARKQQKRVVSLDDFLGERGLSSPISDYTLDTTRLPHGETERQKKKRIAEGVKQAQAYADRRNAAIKEYERLVKDGTIRKPTKIEELQRVARGHPDNDSVQAARRLLKKRGYSW